MKSTVCELESPPIKEVIEQNYIPWYSKVDYTSEWEVYRTGLGGFTLPLICVIDPNDSDNYLDRSTSVQSPDAFYARLRSHITSYALSVTKAGSGKGTITFDGGELFCGVECEDATKDFNSGEVVTLSAAAAEGSVFNGWSGGCSGTGTCQVTMNQTVTVTATFVGPGEENDSILLQLIPLLIEPEKDD